MTKKTRVTGKDVALAAGVSPNTVSLVMRNSPLITETTRSHVLRISRELGYQQNAAAAALRSTRSRTIGYFLPEESLTGESDVFRNEIMQMVVRAAKERQYYVLVDTYVDVARCVALVQSGRIDGILLDYEIPDDVLAPLIHMQIPLVVVGRDAGTYPVNWVKGDEAEGAFRAVDYMAQLGHRHIGLVSVAKAEQPLIAEREMGYHRALTTHGITMDERLIKRGDWSLSSGLRLAQELLNDASRPTAIFAVTEILASACLRVAHSLHIRVPQDLTIVTIGDSMWVEAVQPCLTSVRIAMNEVGQQAAEILFAAIEHQVQGGKSQVVIPSHLIVRDSSGPPA